MQLAVYWKRQSRQKILNQLQSHWPQIKRWLTIIFFATVAFLLYNRATSIEWQKVLSTLRETEASSLAIGFALGFLCYSAYATYDLFGRHILRLRINAFATWAAAWISYACNLNLGALVGSVAFRYRLYSRLGVSNGDVTRILGITVLSNWMGYFLLAGGLFISGTLVPPKNWFVNQLTLQLIGAGFLVFY